MRPTDYFARSASEYPDRIALVDAERSFSYQQGMDFIERVAGALARDLAPGAHVAIYSPNDSRVSLLQLAINAAGMAWISVHPGSSIDANIGLLDKLNCDLIFINPFFGDAIPAIIKAVPNIQIVAMDSINPDIPFIEQWWDPSPSALLDTEFNPQDPAMLQPTGGTTGEPKGVIHTNQSLEASILTFAQENPALRNSRMLVVAPLTHGAGVWALAGLAARSTIYVQSGFNVVSFLESIETNRITSVFLPPTALYAILDHPEFEDFDLSSLKTILIGAAPISPHRFAQAVQEFGPILYEVFGQSETLAPITCKRPTDYLRDDGRLDLDVLKSVGKPVYNAWIKILNDGDEFADVNESGEIVVRSTMVMAGYYNNPDESMKTRVRGWHRTGDVGYIDARGFLFIVDRKRDMIISGGFNIYPTQIENVINSHPGVHDCVVVGVPDEKWGEAVKAVIQPKAGCKIEPEEIIDLCREKLGRVYCPKSVEQWADLPRSAVGKLLRREVRQAFWQNTQTKI